LIALEIDTGKLVWERHVAEAEKYELMIMAPLVYEDLVITGIGISEYGVKGVGSGRSGSPTASRYGDLMWFPARVNPDSTLGTARKMRRGAGAVSG
jgi:hypothetical protein